MELFWKEKNVREKTKLLQKLSEFIVSQNEDWNDAAYKKRQEKLKPEAS